MWIWDSCWVFCACVCSHRPGAVLRHVHWLHGDRCCHLQEPDQEERSAHRPAQLQMAQWWEYMQNSTCMSIYWLIVIIYTNNKPWEFLQGSKDVFMMVYEALWAKLLNKIALFCLLQSVSSPLSFRADFHWRPPDPRRHRPQRCQVVLLLPWETDRQ